jgi:hypothetical protein
MALSKAFPLSSTPSFLASRMNLSDCGYVDLREMQWPFF